MSIAERLPEVDPNFIEPCPFCGRENRMVVRGTFRLGDIIEQHPDMGYYFCNCKNVFYTRHSNLNKHIGFSSERYPLVYLGNMFNSMEEGETLVIIAPDPFFVDWQQDPYEFLHWNPREVYMIWNMDGLVHEAESIGFEVILAEHEFNVDSENPQTFKVILKKNDKTH